MNVAERLVERFGRTPDAPAIVDGRGRTTTYRELLEAAALTRTSVRRAHLVPGSRVILQTPPGLPFTRAAIALLLEGLIPVGIEAAQGDDVFLDRVALVGAVAVMTSPAVRNIQRVDAVRRRLARAGILVPPALDLPHLEITPPSGSRPEGLAAPVADAEADAFIVFTGGTTSKPRGVRLSHRAVDAYLDGLSELPEWDGLISVAADHPQQVVYGLAHGKTVFLTKAGTRRRPRHLAELLFRNGVEGYFGSPTTWAAVLDHQLHREPSTSPKAALVGGAPVTRPLLERFEAELPAATAVRCLYGMTELGLIAHVAGPDKLARLRDGVEGDPVGRLLDGRTARVIDDELAVAGPSRFSGYLGEPSAVADEPFATGDLATVNGAELVLLGRRKDMIVSQGVNLYAGQFESRLLELTVDARRAFDAVALIRETVGDLGDERFVLCYTPHTPLDEAAALALAAPVFPSGHAPSAALRVREMPVGGRQNKLDRRALAALVEARPAESAPSGRLRELQGANRALLERTVPASAKRRLLTQLTARNLARVERLDDTTPSAAPDPVFILGHQRSGTTALHRALCDFPGTDAFTLLDMVAPHPLGWRLLGPVANAAAMLERGAARRGRATALLPTALLHPALQERVGALHRLGLNEPEEEEWLFAALGLSGFVPAAFPETLASRDFDALRDRAGWPAGAVDELLDRYAAVLASRRRRRPVAPGSRHVAKNPAFGPIADRLDARFPNATFLVLVREPSAAIASRLDLYEAIHGRRLTDAEREVIVADSLRQMEGLATNVALLPPDRTQCYWFDRFVSDPAAVVRHAADLAGLSSSSSRPLPPRTPRPVDLDRHRLDATEVEASLPAYSALARTLRTQVTDLGRVA